MKSGLVELADGLARPKYQLVARSNVTVPPQVENAVGDDREAPGLPRPSKSAHELVALHAPRTYPSPFFPVPIMFSAPAKMMMVFAGTTRSGTVTVVALALGWTNVGVQ